MFAITVVSRETLSLLTPAMGITHCAEDYPLGLICPKEDTMNSIPEIIILKLGDREYELVSFLEAGETSIDGNEMVLRAERLNANNGEDDGSFILAHQAEIPVDLREEIALVFPDWRNPGDPRDVAYSYWHVRQWVQHWRSFFIHWYDLDRLVRRRLPTGEAGK